MSIKQTKSSKLYPALGKRKRLKPNLSILSTDNTRTSHSSGSVAQEAHVPITTFVVVLIHADVRAPQLRASPTSRAPHTSPDPYLTTLL